jgi:hypothetical protein
MTTNTTNSADGSAGAGERAIIDGLLCEQTYISSDRERCHPEYELPRWDRIQAAIDYISRAAIDKGDTQAGGGDLLNDYIELNMSNYNEDDVSRLNEWGIRAYDALSAGCAEGGKSEAVAFYDGRSKEPCLLWAFDGYKPSPHDVVLVAAPIAPRAISDDQIRQAVCKATAEVGIAAGGMEWNRAFARAILAAADKEAQS